MLNSFKNYFFFLAGIIFLTLAKIKSILQGYSSPKTFAIRETKRCVEYDIDVVDNWLGQLSDYTSASKQNILRGKKVLELGPGSDLGVGLYLLTKHVTAYNAVDVNNLVQSVPKSFYDALFTQFKDLDSEIDVNLLRRQLENTSSGNNDKLNYLCREDFDIATALNGREVDMIFSQAAFEHFDDIDETIQSVSKVAAKGAVAIILIDLKTHSRWIKDKDPNNIYRYPEWLYRLFSFRGIPNRVRPYQYKAAFEHNGWENVEVKAKKMLPSNRYQLIKRYLNSNYIEEKNQMEYLSVWLRATKL